MEGFASHSRILTLARKRFDDDKTETAASVLEAFPEARHTKSIVLELAYEEYCRRLEAGEDINVKEFCGRFPICAVSLRRRVDVHEFIDEHLDDLIDCEIWPKAGDTFGDFKLVQELGRGIASRVFVARERLLANRLVVLKLSNCGYREARVLSRLQHANVVPIHSVEEDDGLVAICMPFTTRWTLMDFLDAAFQHGIPPARFSYVIHRLPRESSHVQPTVENDPLPNNLRRATYLDGVLTLTAQICEALRHTHERNILHLDLKPTNVLLTSSGRPLICDFNLSVEASIETAYGGTLPYMSPEQLASYASRSEVDVRSDVFSLGVMLYQLLSGRLPFAAEHEAATIEERAGDLIALQRAGADPLSCVAGLDSSTSNLVNECLSFDPAKRPANMRTLLARIRRLQQADGRAIRWVRAHKGIAASLLLVSALSVGGIGYAIATREPRHVVEYNRGTSLLDQGEYHDAVTALSRAIELRPLADDYIVQRAKAHRLNEDYKAACADFEKAYEIRPRPEYLAQAGHSRALAGEWTVARELLKSATIAGVDSASLWCCLGHCCIRRHQYADGERAFSEAIRCAPDTWLAYYGRALCRLKPALVKRTVLGQEAVDDVEQALKLGPSHPRLLLDAASIHHLAGRNEFAPARIERVFRLIQLAATEGATRSELTVWKQWAELVDPRLDELVQRTDENVAVEPIQFLPDPL